jgi:hypothetical protein
MHHDWGGGVGNFLGLGKRWLELNPQTALEQAKAEQSGTWDNIENGSHHVSW